MEIAARDRSTPSWPTQRQYGSEHTTMSDGARAAEQAAPRMDEIGAAIEDPDELLMRGLADLLVKNRDGRLDRHPAARTRTEPSALPSTPTPVDLATLRDQGDPSREPDRPLRPGLVLEGKRVLIRSIGSGSFGTVYEARHLGLDRLEAIKFLQDRWLTDPEVRGCFVEEARLMARVRGAHLVEVYDWGLMPGGRPYFVMERLQGQTLRARLSAGARISLDEFFDIAAQVLAALGEAHATDVVHRDIKPENIFLAADGVRLLDFGLARSTSTPSDHGRAGTPLYMAPEIITGGQPHDARADLYALAIIMVEMLAGHHPFRRARPRRRERASAREPLALPSTLGRELPPGLGALIGAGLARARDQRPRSAQQMLDQLTAIHRDWRSSAGGTEIDPRSAARPRLARRRAREDRAPAAHPPSPRGPQPFRSPKGRRADERGHARLPL